MQYLIKAVLVLSCFMQFSPAKAQSNYSVFINKAELNFIDGKYDSALINFSVAFKDRKNIFAKDYYNAALCAIRLNRLIKTNEYVDSLFKKGFDILELKKKEDFRPYTNSVYFKNLLETSKKEDIVNVERRKNQDYIEELIKDDQYFRIKNPGDYRNREYKTIIHQIDSINSVKLEWFIKEKGFPNEFNCSFQSDFLCYSPAELIILHQPFGKPSREKDFSKIMLAALKKEEVLAHTGINLYYTSVGNDTLFGHCFFKLEQPDGKYKYAYYPKFINGMEEKYNKNRLSFNAEVLDDYRKKIIYSIKHSDFIFDFKIGVDIQVFNKDISKYIKDVIFIE